MEKETITVYKYHKMNLHLIQLLSLNCFYCATSKELNDPFDGAVELSQEFVIDFMSGKVKLFSINPNDVFKQFYESILWFNRDMILNVDEWALNDKLQYVIYHDISKYSQILINSLKFRIVSFAGMDSLKNESLMWAHYADSFAGVRLEFTFPTKFENEYENQFPLQRVIMRNNNVVPIVHNKFDLFNALLSKYQQWSYEDEYRIVISEKHFPLLEFPMNYLTGIYLGANMNFIQKDFLVRMILKLDYRKIQFYDQYLSKGKITYTLYEDSEVQRVLYEPFRRIDSI